MAHCIIGGTFTCVHGGHVRLLRAAAGFPRITVGLTTDRYVRAHKLYPSFPYAKRLAGLEAALARQGMLSRCEIVPIGADTDRAVDIEADAIVVSGETEAAARRINALRARRGLPPLKIISVPLAYAGSLKKISCEDIYRGKCDLQGKLCAPVLFQAGTENPTKLAGARTALARVFGKKVGLAGHKEKSGVRHHPFGAETFRGAENRARAAWKRAWAGGRRAEAQAAAGGSRAGAISRAKRGCDYSLGIESGLFEIRKGEFFDITVCCVFDGSACTFGTGAGFCVPAWMARKIKGRSDLSRVMAQLAGVEGIGRKQGALGWFSDGVMHRADQAEQSVANAMVPRIAQARKGIGY